MINLKSVFFFFGGASGTDGRLLQVTGTPPATRSHPSRAGRGAATDDIILDHFPRISHGFLGASPPLARRVGMLHLVMMLIE